MTALDLDAIETREQAAFDELVRILSVDEQTHMSIPANPAGDTDLIISASLKDIRALVPEVKRQAELLAKVAELHREVEYSSGSNFCAACEAVSRGSRHSIIWPCDTAKLLGLEPSDLGALEPKAVGKISDTTCHCGNPLTSGLDKFGTHQCPPASSSTGDEQ